MSYHVKRRRGLGDAITDAIASGTANTAPSTISGGTPSMPMLPGAITAAGLQQIRASGPMSKIIGGGTLTPGAQQAVQQAAAAGAAAQAACSTFTDPVANRFCIESAQVLSGQDLVNSVQAKLACEQVIQGGALTDDQRQDCVVCAMKQQRTRGAIDPSTLAQDTVDYEAQKAFAVGAAQAGFFAKHKVAVFAVGGVALSALLVTAIMRRKHRPTPNRARRLSGPVVGSGA